MQEDPNFERTKELICRDFELKDLREGLTEEELLNILANQVAYMIEYQLDFLLSLMYRLDIDERKVNQALTPTAPVAPNIAIARLILDRQKKRVMTKMKYKPEEFTEWEDF